MPGAFANLKISCPCCAPLQLDDDDEDDYVAPQLDELPPELAKLASTRTARSPMGGERYAASRKRRRRRTGRPLAACASPRLRPASACTRGRRTWSTTPTLRRTPPPICRALRRDRRGDRSVQVRQERKRREGGARTGPGAAASCPRRAAELAARPAGSSVQRQATPLKRARGC